MYPYDDSTTPIEVRLELKGMRYTILQAVYNHNDEIKRIAEKEVDEALNSFDFAGKVKQEINLVLSDIIKKSITSAINDVFYDNEVQERLRKYVVENIKFITEEK